MKAGPLSVPWVDWSACFENRYPSDERARMRSSSIATDSVDFNLHTLGWKAFQDLCLTVLQTSFGQDVQRFAAVNDGGRDGAFRGKWRTKDGSETGGETVVQCKFSNRRDSSITIASAAEEISKAAALQKHRKRHNYILLTNQRVSATFDEHFTESLLKAGYDKCEVFGAEWITSAIRSSPSLRSLVPRLYGLGDLSQVVDQRWYEQTNRLLENERSNLRRFVPTDAYRAAVRALAEQGFVLLVGDPAVGKSAIASTICLAAGDTWHCLPMKLENAAQLRERANPNERQLFWIDDAFGALQYESTRTREWNQVLPWMQEIVRNGSKIIVTSRGYIYSRARTELKQGAFPLLQEAKVVVDVMQLTTAEREQILYNHVRFGSQPITWRREFKRFFPFVARHARFSPEIARRLGESLFTEQLVLSNAQLETFILEQGRFLLETIEGLDSENRAALAAVFLRGGALHSPISLSADELRLVERVGGSAAIGSALQAMRDSLVHFSREAEAHWSFKHPTIRDGFADYIARDHELIDLYIRGASAERLMAEVTCGAVEIENVRIVVPPSRFQLILARLIEFANDSTRTWWDRSRFIDGFLASRCAPDFLELYIEADKRFWDRALGFGSFMSVTSSFGLLAKLRDHGLLREAHRLRLIANVKELAVQTPDADFLRSPSISQFFLPNELTEIMQHVHEELLPHLDETIEEWKDNRSRKESAGTYYSPLIEALTAYREYFHGNVHADSLLARAINTLHSLIPSSEAEEWLDDDDQVGASAPSRPSVQPTIVPARPIYDDLDEATE